MERGVTACFIVVLSVLGYATLSTAKEYPTKLVNLIDNYGPGGGTDPPARVLSSVIVEFLGQPMIVITKLAWYLAIGFIKICCNQKWIACSLLELNDDFFLCDDQCSCGI